MTRQVYTPSGAGRLGQQACFRIRMDTLSYCVTYGVNEWSEHQGANVSDHLAIKLSSLNIIQSEFLVSVQAATNQLEQLVSKRDSQDALQDSLACLQQLHGVLQMLQLTGADLLLFEMIAALKTVTAGAADAAGDKVLTTLSLSVFILARYFEYVQQHEREMPILILPIINELRATHKQPPLADSHFLQMNTNVPPVEKTGSAAPFSVQALHSYRHMYQVGVLGVLQGKDIQRAQHLILHALKHINAMCSSFAFANTLWAALNAIAVMLEKSMSFTPSRKRLLSTLDGQLKQLLRQGEAFLQIEHGSNLLREFVYIVSVSGSESDTAHELSRLFSVVPLGYTDADFLADVTRLHEPDLSTAQSLVETIQEELRNSKNILELSTQGGDIVAAYQEMIASLRKVSDVLIMIGLVTQGQCLRDQVEKLCQWETEKHVANTGELMEITDILLYVESSVAALKNAQLSHSKLAEMEALSKDKLKARGQVLEAEQVALNEVSVCWGSIKQAVTLYVESAYDKNKISNLNEIFTAVRGVFVLINMPRAVTVTASCIRFVDEQLLQGEVNDLTKQRLELFADTLMSLESFFETYSTVQKQDALTLSIAEDRVRELGYLAA